MFTAQIMHFIANKSGSLISFLQEQIDLQETDILFLLGMGSLYVNKKRQLHDIPIAPSDYIRVHIKPRRFCMEQVGRQNIVFENENYIIFNKPHGVPVHETLDNAVENMKCYFENSLSQSLYVTQRIDINTQGLFLMAKNPKFQTYFNKLLAQRKIEKEYEVFTKISLAPHLYVHYMEPSPRAPKKVSRVFHEGWHECQMEVFHVEPWGRFYKHRVRLLTGRTHQIRAQFSDLGAPLVGDVFYGGDPIQYPNCIGLISSQLSFPDLQLSVASLEKTKQVLFKIPIENSFSPFGSGIVDSL